MGKITVLPETTVNPITKIGERAGLCWGADISNPEKNYKRGLDCIKANHGRTLEFVNVELIIEGYSARVIREWYTHIGGSPTRLQASTRYIDYDNFPYITPKSICKNPKAKEIYENIMNDIIQAKKELDEVGVPTEDSAMILPLGMATKIVDKRNLRNLIDMSRQRMCTRAYWEYRDMLKDVFNALSEISEEWKIIIDTQMMPRCEYLGRCEETRTCGKVKNK